MIKRLLSWIQKQPDRYFYVALLLSITPLWVTSFPPIVDLPQHTGQIASLYEWLIGNPFYREHFEVNWFTPYLGGNLLILLLTFILPVVSAVKVVLSLALMAIPWMTGKLLREFGGDERLKWLAIPCSFCYAFYYGLLSYLIAVPLGLGFLLLVIRLNQKPNKKIILAIAVCSVLLFFFHLIVLGFASMMSLVYLAVLNRRSLKRLVLLSLPYTTPIPLILYWMVQAQLNEPSLRDEPVVFAGMREKVVHLVTQVTGLDGYAYFVGLFMFTCVVLAPCLSGFRITRSPVRIAFFLAAFSVYLAFPAFAQNTAFLYQRLAVFIVPFWLLLWESPEHRIARCFWPVVFTALLAWWGANLYRFTVFERDLKPFRVMLSSMEPGQHVGALLFRNTHPLFSHPVLLHFPAWYQAVGGGMTDMSFATTHPSIIRYPVLDRKRIDEFVLWEPIELRQEFNNAQQYDYLIICAEELDTDEYFRTVGIRTELVRRDGLWSLFKVLAKRE